jgi:hypothetical protein
MKLNQLILLRVTSVLASIFSISGSAAGALVNLSTNAVSPTPTSTGTNIAVAQN